MNQERLPIPADITTRLVDIMASALTEVEIAEDFQIVDDESAELAAAQLSAVAKTIKNLDEERLGYTRPYDALKSDIKSEYDKPVEKLKIASDLLRSRLTAWTKEQDRKREELLRAERERIEAERAEAERVLARERERAASLKTTAAIERAEARIEDAESKVLETQVAAPMVAKPTKLKGFSARTELKADYAASDIVEMAKAVVAMPSLARFLEFNTVEVNKVVKAMQANATTIIPGLKLVSVDITTAR